jgi:hypothetical protein
LIWVIILILVVLAICWFSFKKKKADYISDVPNASNTVISEPAVVLNNAEILTDDVGRKYTIEKSIIQIPRKTYIRGKVHGKYRGDLIDPNESLHNTTIYEFTIYEAEVTCSEFRTNEPFENPGQPFPKEKLPNVLSVALLQEDKHYGLNVLEPKLFAFHSLKKLHQIEGDKIYGTFTAEITGYVLDYTEHEQEELIYIDEIPEIPKPITPIATERLVSSGTETGKFETKGNYTRKEYFATNYRDTLWGKWHYVPSRKPNAATGCFSSAFSGIAVLLLLVFLIIIIPNIGLGLLLVVLMLLVAAFSDFFIWLFRIIGFIFLIVFLFALARSFNQTTYKPEPKVADSPRETKPDITPVKDSVTQSIKDTIISRYRNWEDYDGTSYEGKYTLRLKDCRDSGLFKNNLQLTQNSIDGYDEVLYSLKERDKGKLNGLYQLFDSINKVNQLSKIKFAEMVVSFVQDIPYALILEKDCNVSSYTDSFTRKYLLSPEALCEGGQKFGINTPAEFLVNLKGDCDTRTLLLYTIFTHYKYDVALLSSEQYAHSIIGINLPINGTAYNFNNVRYVLWETTAPNCRPGSIPSQISNLNNWRISLKSR